MQHMRPEISFNGYSEPWARERFGDYATLKRGLTYTPSDLLPAGRGVRVLRSSNIDDDVFRLHPDDVFVKEEAVNIDFAQEGDILVTAANGSPRLVGKRAKIVNLPDKAVAGGFMYLASSSTPNFLNALLGSPWYRRFLRTSVAGGGGSIGNLDRGALSNSYTLIPNPSEQEIVGTFFAHLDSLLNSSETEIEKLKALKATMLTKMFPQGDSLVPEIRFEGFSDKWESCTLGQLGYTYTGLNGKTKHDFGHGQAGYITYLNVNAKPLTDGSSLGTIEIDPRQNEVRPGDILFTTSSEVPEEVGMSSVVESVPDNTYLNSFCFGYRPHSSIELSFWAYALRAPYIRSQFITLAQGISRFNISKQKAMAISILLPGGDEQRLVGSYFREIDVLIDSQNRIFEQLQHLKSAFLRSMFV